ncbi:P-loop containing nucleoside triphosphate hydrolases superfamily protein [Perilla frutescens var. frutescens]|nr:P-loop containing nucleoside triphosphate hydrolases superfamily protein [Perilla frutescens var. frutescens]
MTSTWSRLQLWHAPPYSLLFRRRDFPRGGTFSYCGYTFLLLILFFSFLSPFHMLPAGFAVVNFFPAKNVLPTMCFCRQLQTTTYEIVNGSYVPIGDAKQASEVEDKVVKALEAVGAFQKLPMVMPSVDVLCSALKKAKRVSPTKGIANIAKRERNRGAKQLDALMKELAVPLRKYTENFPDKKSLHPYERSLVELTLGDGNYEEVLRKVDNLRKRVVSVGKEHASLCAKSLTKREAEERLSEGMKKIEEIFNHQGRAVDELLNIAKTLRAMPVVNLEAPTLCLVGAPNVGKSSLVRLLSTGKPEICNYPFTTRGILMGHINLSYQNFQVTDTPGLLRRHDEDRNNLEKLTLAVLSHLPTAVLYVHDLSGECGTSPSDQFTIYEEIKERFGDHLWIDVVSKCDLLSDSPVVFITEDSNADSLELANYRRMGPDGAIYASVKTKVGIDELKTTVHELLVIQSERLKSFKINEEGLQYHRNSSLRSTTSEEISADTTVFRKDEPETVVDAQLVETKEDYGSQLNEELQEGSLFDNPLKLFKFLEDLNIKLDYEQTYSFLAFGGGGAVALWLVAAVISAVDSIPVLPKALELVGLGYTLWFSSRYLILKKNRDELFTRVEQLKQQILGSDDDLY